jgi:hypothetical protein
MVRGESNPDEFSSRAKRPKAFLDAALVASGRMPKTTSSTMQKETQEREARSFGEATLDFVSRWRNGRIEAADR